MTHNVEDDDVSLSADPQPFDFADWGVDVVVYVRPLIEDDQLAWGVFGVDGQCVGVAPDREAAMVAARHNDLNPYSVH